MRPANTLRLLSVMTLVQCTISGIFGPILLQILINVHLDPDVISHLGKYFGNGMFSVVLVYLLCPAFLFLAPLVGAYTDEWGRKKFLCAAIFASILGYALIWFSLGWANESLFLFGLFFFSASKTYLPIAMSAMSDLSTAKKKEFSFGLIYLIMLMIIFASQYGYYVLEDHYDDIYLNMEKILVFLMIFEGLNLALAVFIFSESLRKKTPVKHPLVTRILFQVERTFKHKKIPALFGLLLCTSFFWSFYFQIIYETLTKKFGLSDAQSDQFILYYLTVMFLGALLLYRYFIKSITYHRTLSIFGLTSIGFIGCGLFSSSLVGQIIFVVPLAIGSIIIGPLLCSLISREWDKTQQGLLMGIIAPALVTTWIFSGIVSIALQDEFSRFAMPSLAVGGTIILGLVGTVGKKLFAGEKH